MTVTEGDDPVVTAAIVTARQVAQGCENVALLHCAEEATHRLVYPDQPDHALRQRLDRAIAATLAGEGVRVFAQIVDPARYLAWLDGRESTAAWRRAYRDRERLVAGEAALALFQLPATAARPRQAAPPAAKRTPADQLIRNWLDGAPMSDPALSALLDAGRQGIVDMAIRKVADRYADEAVEDFLSWLDEAAENLRLDPCGAASLMVLPVLARAGATPTIDAAALARGFLASGTLGADQEAAFLPHWFDVEAVTELTACQIRRTLRDLLEGQAPAALAPLDPASSDGAMVLLGVVKDHYPVMWEAAVASLLEATADPEGLPPDDPDPVHERHDAAFDRWRDRTLDANPGLIDILYPSTPAALAEDMAVAEEEDEPGQATADLAEEVRDFIEIAEEEAGGEAIVGVLGAAEGQVELSLYTASGRLLDARAFDDDDAAELPEIIADLVTIVDRPPGRG